MSTPTLTTPCDLAAELAGLSAQRLLHDIGGVMASSQRILEADGVPLVHVAEALLHQGWSLTEQGLYNRALERLRSSALYSWMFGTCTLWLQAMSQCAVTYSRLGRVDKVSDVLATMQYVVVRTPHSRSDLDIISTTKALVSH